MLVASTGKINGAAFKAAFKKRFGHDLPLKAGQKLKGLLRAAEDAGAVRLEQIGLVLWICPAARELPPVARVSPAPQLRPHATEATSLDSDPHNLPAHIFVDYSNILLGAKKIPHFRLTLPKLTKLVEAGRVANERVLFGSYSASEKTWAAKKLAECDALHYSAYFSERPVGEGEQFVDDALIAQMQHTLLASSTPRTLVLLTGDGNDNHGRASFVTTVEHFLRRGWKVEIWSWKKQTSATWKKMSTNLSDTGNFLLMYLDDYTWALADRLATPRAPPNCRPRLNPPSSA